MKTKQELKEIYINSHHKIVEKFFDEMFEMSGKALNQESFTPNMDKLQEQMKKEIEQLDLTKEEKEYIKQNVKEWSVDNEFNHDLMRHIFKKIIDNKDKISNKKF